MPRYQFQFSASGLVVPLVVGPDDATVGKLLRSNTPFPALVYQDGLIDTGCTRTCVSARIVTQLGLPFWGYATSTTVSGSSRVRLFECSIGIPPTPLVPVRQSWDSQLLVMELTQPLDHDILIGRDLVAKCRLLIDGRMGVFDLEL